MHGPVRLYAAELRIGWNPSNARCGGIQLYEYLLDQYSASYASSKAYSSIDRRMMSGNTEAMRIDCGNESELFCSHTQSVSIACGTRRLSRH